MEIDRLGSRCGDKENCAMNAPLAPPPMLLLVDDDPAVLASTYSHSSLKDSRSMRLKAAKL